LLLAFSIKGVEGMTEGEMTWSIKQQKRRKKTALHCFFAFSQRLSLLILKKSFQF